MIIETIIGNKEKNNSKVKYIVVVVGFIVSILFMFFLEYKHLSNKNLVMVDSKAITDWSKINKNNLNTVTIKFNIKINPLEISYFDYVLDDNITGLQKKNIKISILDIEKPSSVTKFLVGIQYDQSEEDLYSYLVENPDAVRIKITDKNGYEKMSSTKVKFDLNKTADSIPDF